MKKVIVKQSFLSNLIGRSFYEEIKVYAIAYIVIGSCVLAILWVLSYFYHVEFISSLLNLTTGTSLLFIAYIAALVLLFDIRVEEEEIERDYWEKPVKTTKSSRYKLTTAWGIILIILGIAAIYFTNIYRKQYSFECETFLVDRQKGIYHLTGYFEDCEKIDNDSRLVEMQGYEIEKLTDCVFCEYCEDLVEDEEFGYDESQYYHYEK